MALRDLATRKRFVKFSNATGWPLSNAMLGLKHQSVGRPREAVLGLPSRNCTPRRGVGSAFRARRLMSLHPRAKAPDFAKPTSRLAFRRHLPQHEGRHSFSDGGLGYSLDRSAVTAVWTFAGALRHCSWTIWRFRQRRFEPWMGSRQCWSGGLGRRI